MLPSRKLKSFPSPYRDDALIICLRYEGFYDCLYNSIFPVLLCLYKIPTKEATLCTNILIFKHFIWMDFIGRKTAVWSEGFWYKNNVVTINCKPTQPCDGIIPPKSMTNFESWDTLFKYINVNNNHNCGRIDLWDTNIDDPNWGMWYLHKRIFKYKVFIATTSTVCNHLHFLLF